MERIVSIYPVFLELIEQIGVKIGYGKVMILSTCRLVQKIAVNIGYVKLGYIAFAGY